MAQRSTHTAQYAHMYACMHTQPSAESADKRYVEERMKALAKKGIITAPVKVDPAVIKSEPIKGVCANGRHLKGHESTLQLQAGRPVAAGQFVGKRIDAEDGCAYSFADFLDYHNSDTAQAQAHWLACMPATE